METSIHRCLSMNLVVIDLGTSNMRSLTSALSFLGAPYLVATEPSALETATHVILPGVGAFDAAMSKMAELSLIEPLRRHAATRPMLGVCVGMQLLFDGSDEGRLPGLGLVPGRFLKLSPPPETGGKVPHVGFSLVRGYRPISLFKELGPEAYFYFTHSYSLPTLAGGDNVGVCDYAQPFVAAFQKGRLCGAQFHPEKSQSNGLRLFSNFLELA